MTINELDSSNTNHSGTTPTENSEHNNLVPGRPNSNVLNKEGVTGLDTDSGVTNVDIGNPVNDDNHSIDSTSSFSFVCDTMQLIED